MFDLYVGYVFLFGEKLKKIISFFVKGKKCRICVVVKFKGNFFCVYQCCKNWIGLVKVMELVMVCEMFEKVEMLGGKVIVKYFY